MAAEIDEGEEVLPADADGDDDGDEEAASVDELGLPMPVLAVEDALSLLRDGELELVGRLWASTNNAMLCVARHGDAGGSLHLQARDGRTAAGRLPGLHAGAARGGGLHRLPGDRLGDRAAHGAARRAVRRGHGPALDPADAAVDPVALVVNEDPRLRRMAAFDAAVNNTDRKAGHLVPVPGGHVYGVDHGVTFSPVPKLRTVLWTWRGQPFSDEEPAVLRELRRGLDESLGSRAARAPRSDRGGGHDPAASTGCSRRGCSRSPIHAGRRSPGRRSEARPSSRAEIPLREQEIER